MAVKIKLDNIEYDASHLDDDGKAKLVYFQFATKRIQELTNMQSLLNRAKNSYVASLKKELLSNKAGLLFEDD